ncbi:TRAP transporter substrate-binding protein [Noviherbaspirillum sp.]|jgi:TRAP-type C4-dicarboxylate transport system substrate-binding protein|uniref:TRAP transporter substrate-binding protein n=1 Tax=Noviherbaspirillum sp. TaxID=1926288 RepID=UPI0025E45141|nr:TRAP transporter substrate-binding protein [Noviherbaspirillum sp.]
MKPLRQFLVIAALAAASHAATAESKWDFPTAYPPSSFHTENIQQFANEIDKATGGKLKMTIHSNGSLYKANEIKRAVQTGQAQIGEILLSGAANENPLYGVDSIPFLATSYAEAKKLANAARPATEKLLAAQGMKLLYVSPWPPQGLFSIKPVNSLADLRSTKMRAYNPATNRIAQLAKAQPTTIQLSELGQALATGAVDNFLTSTASGIENKLYEQTKYFYDINAWVPKNAVIVSQKSFDALDKASQEAVLKAAQAAEARAWKVSEEKDQEYAKQLAANGMKVASPSAQFKSELQTIGATMTAEWMKSASAEARQVIDTYKQK